MTFTIGTLYSALVLAAVTAGIAYGILRAATPAIVLDVDQKFVAWKALVFACSLAFIFATIVTLISVKVDEQFALKKNI